MLVDAEKTLAVSGTRDAGHTAAVPAPGRPQGRTAGHVKDRRADGVGDGKVARIRPEADAGGIVLGRPQRSDENARGNLPDKGPILAGRGQIPAVGAKRRSRSW
jgi:hypothetical protein